MVRTAIEVDNVSKEFLVEGLGDYQRLTEAAVSWARRAIRRVGGEGPQSRPFRALEDVSFTVAAGESLGIVGSNGAGKSTLLKILSRIITPTSGRVGVRGRIGCLLEVGTGFHPELTGRENVFLNGAILGMPRREIRRRFDAIVDFAGVEAFLDMPVKRYSNGMLIRLGFSVAAHLDPDVLIVDEVLGVGDAEFQRKSLGKAQEFRNEGRTVLMVSHNLPMIAAFCNRAILLQRGRLVADGPPREVIDRHLSFAAEGPSGAEWTPAEAAPQTDYAKVERVSVRGADVNDERSPPRTDRPVDVCIDFRRVGPPRRFFCSVMLHDETGEAVLKSVQAVEPEGTGTGGFRLVCSLPADLLNAKRYVLGIDLGRTPRAADWSGGSLLGFEVHDADEEESAWNAHYEAFPVRPKLRWRVELLSPAGPRQNVLPP